MTEPMPPLWVIASDPLKLAEYISRRYHRHLELNDYQMWEARFRNYGTAEGEDNPYAAKAMDPTSAIYMAAIYCLLAELDRVGAPLRYE